MLSNHDSAFLKPQGKSDTFWQTRHKGTKEGRNVAPLPGTAMMVWLIEKQRKEFEDLLKWEKVLRGAVSAPLSCIMPNGACCLESCLRTSAWARTHFLLFCAFFSVCFIYQQHGAHLHDNNNKMSQKISIKLFNVSSVSTRFSALNFRCQVISNWILNIQSGWMIWKVHLGMGRHTKHEY